MLTLKQVPFPEAGIDAIQQFALSFNGYEHARDIAAMANAVAKKFREEETLETDHLSLDDLRAILFFEQRRFHHWGFIPEEGEEYMRRLILKIRERLVSTSAFIFNSGGHFGDSFRVSIDADGIHYSRFSHEAPPLRSFIKRNEEKISCFFNWFRINCRDWDKDYFQPATDGSSWSLKIASTDLEFTSSGSNAFPPNYDDFIIQLRLLLGGLKLY